MASAYGEEWRRNGVADWNGISSPFRVYYVLDELGLVSFFGCRDVHYNKVLGYIGKACAQWHIGYENRIGTGLESHRG